MRGGAAHPLPSEASDEAAAGSGWGRLLVEINESELTLSVCQLPGVNTSPRLVSGCQ